MTVRKSHPFIRFIYNRLREEHLAWRIMFREEWVSLLVVLGSVLLVVFFTRPLPPREVTLAVGQPGSTTEQLGRRYQEIFAQQVRETMERRAAGLKPPAWAAAAFESGLRQSTEEEKSDGRAA